ncbi:MAG: hypothetical protein L0Y74_03840 [candidate division Zixibacteria bacterium]|nr:hypothetical protein [candidate division Zixibacteria bacterium]
MRLSQPEQIYDAGRIFWCGLDRDKIAPVAGKPESAKNPLRFTSAVTNHKNQHPDFKDSK